MRTSGRPVVHRSIVSEQFLSRNGLEGGRRPIARPPLEKIYFVKRFRTLGRAPASEHRAINRFSLILVVIFLVLIVTTLVVIAGPNEGAKVGR